MYTGLVQCIIILWWNNATAHADNIVAAECAQFGDKLRHECHVTSRLRRYTNNMHVGVDCLTSHLSGRRE